MYELLALPNLLVAVNRGRAKVLFDEWEVRLLPESDDLHILSIDPSEGVPLVELQHEGIPEQLHVLVLYGTIAATVFCRAGGITGPGLAGPLQSRQHGTG
jgi:hypothetical protein